MKKLQNSCDNFRRWHFRERSSIKQIHISYYLHSKPECVSFSAMDTHSIKVFLAVAEYESFSLASEKLHLTQPAVSKRIAQLEEQLGHRLLDRMARSVSLTEAGKLLLPYAKQILSSIDETQQAMNDLSGETSGQLRLAISHHIGLHRLPGVLKSYVAKYPKVCINIEFMDSEVAYEGIQHAKFDIAVNTLAPQSQSSIIDRQIWHDPLVLTISRDHPLAARTQVDMALLGKYPAVLPGMSTYTGRMIKQLFDEKDVTLNASMATNYLETVKMMVSVGLGWSLLPKTMVDDSVRMLCCQGIDLARRLGYIHHKERTLSNAARAFLTELESAGDPKTDLHAAP